MPRVTRAALRSNMLAEEANLAASTPLPLTPLAQRAPLGEITGNTVEAAPAPNLCNHQSNPEKNAPSKGKRGRVKKPKKPEQKSICEEGIDVLEDDNRSATSSAVNEACQELLKENNGDIHQVIMHDQRPHTPPSPAVNAVRKRSSQDGQSLLDPDMLISNTTTAANLTNDEEERLPATTDSSTLVTVNSSESVGAKALNEESQEGNDQNKGDLKIEKIVIRSPNKPIARIEDSVEAIDAFEEAIEKVGQLIPAIAEDHISTVETKKQRRVVSKTDTNNDNKNASKSAAANSASIGSVAARSGKPLQKTRVPSQRQAATLPAQKPKTQRTNAPQDEVNTASTNISKASQSSPPVKASKPRVTSTKRVSSIHKAPFQPIKSTKQPTRPSFELPGDAVARRLKEQREERLKRGDEEPPKKPAFKARPVRLSSAPAVKSTRASNARISIAKLDAGDSTVSKSRAPLIKPITRSASISAANSNKRLSTTSVPRRDTMTSSNTSKRVTSHPLSKGVKTSGNASEISGGDVSAFDLAQQKLRGKEVFNRVRVEQDERERAKREKEEAARKARAEAAERGRIASREWAEKQKLKKMGLEGGSGSKGALAAA